MGKAASSALRAIVLGACVLSTLGCIARRTDVVNAKRDIMVQGNNNRQEISREILDLANNDIAKLKADIAAADTLADALRKDLDAQVIAEQKREQRYTGFVTRAADKLTRLTNADILFGSQIDGFKSDLTQQQSTLVKASERVLATERTASRLDITVNNQREKLDAANAKAADLERTLRSLNTETRDKFANISSEQLMTLEKVRDNRREFDAELLKVGVTAKEVEDLKGFSMEQILALIAAAGAGGVLGKTGKSRAQSEVDGLKKRLDAAVK